MRNSSHYLLNIQKEPEKFVIKISGSSRNIYTVTVDESTRTMCCDCPDSRSWAKHYKCVCWYIVALCYLNLRGRFHY